MISQYAGNVVRYLSVVLLLALVSIYSYTTANENKHGDSEAGTNEERRIQCHFAYRSSEKESHTWRRDVVLVKNAPVKLQHGEFKIIADHMDYRDDAPSLLITVEHKDTGKKLLSTLHQFDSLPSLKNQFGGQGFTGLNYVYAPDSQAELQYSCTVKGD